MALTDQKKQEWLQKTQNPVALELLEKNKSVLKNKTEGLLHKENGDNEVENEKELEEVTDTETTNEDDTTQVENPSVESNADQTQTTGDTTPSTTPGVVEKSDNYLTVDDVQPLIDAVETLTNKLATIEKSLGDLQKSANTENKLIPAAAQKPKDIIKQRLSFVNTFMTEAGEDLEKDAPAEETVQEQQTSKTFSGFLVGQ